VSPRDFLASYIERGWVVIPVGYRDKKPLFDGWSEQTIEKVIENLDRDFPPDKPTNVGVSLGAPSGGLSDLDLDCPEALELADVFLPPTLTFGRTSTPRSHRLYSCPGMDSHKFQDPITAKTQDGKVQKRMLVEIRSTGGQTVFPPSVHPSGEPISFVAPWREPLEIEPGALQAATQQLAAACLLARYWPKGGRHDCQLALAGALLSDGWGEDQVIEVLSGICRIAGDEDRPKREATVRGTAEKVRAGEAVTGWKQLGDHYEKRVLAKVKSWLAVRVDPASFTTLSPATDLANARRLVQYFGQDLRHVRKWDRWLAWDGRRWKDGDVAVYQYAKATAEKIYEEAAQAEARGDREFAKFLRKHAKDSCSAAAISNMIRLAKTEPQVAIEHDRLDTDSWLFNVENGTVDLRTGQLREHRREDLITKLCPFPYDPEADCPTWKKSFLEMMQDDQSLVDYVQVLLGYTVTASRREEMFVLMHGGGQNGKSKCVELWRDVIGDDYTVQVETKVLLHKEHGGDHPTGKASLLGKRLAVASEPGATARLAEDILKEISGGEKISARRMHEDFWDFTPTHTIWITTNHRPQIRGTDHGIWRRVIFIPFDVSFKGRADNTLPEKWRAEAAGILAWILDGARAYLEVPNALSIIPERADAAKQDYREEQDRLRDFTDACVELHEEGRVEFKLIYKTYLSWCAEESEQAVSRKAFGQMLTERGFKQDRDKKTKYRLGLKLVGAHAALAGAQSFRPTIVK